MSHDVHDALLFIGVLGAFLYLIIDEIRYDLRRLRDEHEQTDEGEKTSDE